MTKPDSAYDPRQVELFEKLRLRVTDALMEFGTLLLHVGQMRIDPDCGPVPDDVLENARVMHADVFAVLKEIRREQETTDS